ncbi:FIT family protein CG10671-like [Limulus polyphemus]|uniref:FIT family protein CG10671-like n=1 Tax=Limulus polyphemus TaxID=6850 RepID=A0ABM1B937_LIMPO|nr:FIT family protein CG10671-like [Limulus polyphemus]
MRVCRKIVLFKVEYKVLIYIGTVFLISGICDIFPSAISKSYFSRKDNFINQYFVKRGWGWTLLIVGLFIFLTSRTYCRGDKKLISKHMSRLLIATVMWFSCTFLFEYIEWLTGKCEKRDIETKDLCKKSGHEWQGFDISGHTFLLIYCGLIIMEEGRCITVWEGIGKQIVQNYVFEANIRNSTLRRLSENEISELRKSYKKLTPFVQLTFVLMTILLLMWDVMLMATIVYFHSIAQKSVGGIIATGAWLVTYCKLFRMKHSPGLPGEGLLRFQRNSAW